MKVKAFYHKGEEYGAVYNFLRILGQILQMRDFETCTVCWDGYMSGILRYNIYPEYKALGLLPLKSTL